MTVIETLRNSILTSIYGRRLGLKTGDFLVGPKDLAKGTQSLTSANSTATAVTNYGLTILDVTTAAASTASSIGTTELGCSWVMDAPEPGVIKTVMKQSATGGSTMPLVVEFAAGVTAFNSSFTSTATGIMMNAVGQQVTLFGLTTAKWVVMSLSTGASVASS
ncbi:hypothetical protein UFOVP1670_11 [uncultured Caudovirales phage]|uniref:Uncharacterized protein n=1 Tax=uncultured Caudovirales phage TaxID=2100421 RepID=A0A6J5T6B8_9CAUD|nr:hypothetical protein UFOVP1670_11 [uncultured Caudovirales phage]